MYDTDGLKKRLNYGQSFRDLKKKEYTFNFARNSDFVDGVFRFRFLPPHLERAPLGYHLLSLHTIEISPDNDQRVLAQESWDPDYDPNTDPSFIDSLLQLIRDNKDTTYDRMSDAAKNVVNKLLPWRRFLYPVAAYVRKESYMENGRTKVRYYPDNNTEKPTGLIWEVTAEGLVEAIDELFDTYSDLSDLRKGRDLRFTKKGNKYKLMASPTATPANMPALVSDYPNLVRMGLKQKMTDDQILALCQSAWWAKEFAKVGIDLNGLSSESEPASQEVGTLEGDDENPFFSDDDPWGEVADELPV